MNQAILIDTIQRAMCAMTITQFTDEELELYFDFLMENYGVTNIQEFDFMIDDSCVSRLPDINRKHSRIVKADGKSVNMVDLYPEATAKLINTNVIKNSKAELDKKLSNLSIESVRQDESNSHRSITH